MAKLDRDRQSFTDLAEIARALGNGPRLLLLDHIGQGERAVDRLAELCGLSVANTSQHLQHLRRMGFVQSRRDGKRVLYRLGSGPLAHILAALRQYADHRYAEMKKLVADSFGDAEELETITRAELLSRLKEGSVTLLDVRPPEEFALGHLPGALNIPVEELEQRLTDLSQTQEIIAYCRGPYCVLSVEAVTALRASGFRARRFEDGVPDWQAAGLYVESLAATEAM